ncbi:MAG: amidohydrolase family protein [Candidatus Thorarchaeota archaeon]|nr:MAG: amidohydrolase [Candidatus Thorarchaeota archaeon]RLI59828.1 MAG: amidohydrolase [Candidatus Thorarchaeota archaeon]
MAEDTILIKNGYVLTLNKRREIIRDGSIYIRNGLIEEVGKAEEISEKTADRVIDAKRMLVMPGLIDTHVHLAQALIRGCADDVSLVDWLKKYVWVLQGNFTADDGRVSAELCMAEMIRTGTTSFVECMIHSRYGFDGIAQAVERTGMRAALSKIVMDSTGYADSPDIMYHGMVEDADDCLKETDAMYHRWHGKADGRLQVWYGLRSLGAVSSDLFKEVAHLAREKKTHMTMHLGEVVDDVRYVKENFNTNLTGFARDHNLLGPDMVFAHGIHFDDEELKILAETKSNIAHCPASNTKLASGFAKIPRMLELGVPVSLGCDGGPSNNTYDMVREMRLAALIHKPVVNDPLAVSAESVIEMATLGGATAMGIQDRVGSLEVGKSADIILVDLDDLGLTPPSNPVSNVVYSGSGQTVDTTIVNGRILMEGKRLLTLDEEEVKQGVREHSVALLERSGVDISPKWPVL